ncbi:hypothetical protein GYMLUDRAFT_248922 [Collybiopsis luxurians FD-317 M1]|uniref:Uncharacterized protein n=1 Tax=Collybiopsis luxurians FD-317 M1 TaxID=944289 RepID=A0A0D0CAR4_9AGAR|nr:hypothetical protein GYMLUDRAFT_248922 [Collybiopsis luxurians FD-317 M1]
MNTSAFYQADQLVRNELDLHRREIALLRKQLAKEKRENTQNAIRALQLQNRVYTLDAQILAYLRQEEEKNAVYQDLCQRNVNLQQRITELESGGILADLRWDYDAKCEELLQISNGSTKLVELTGVRKEVRQLRKEIAEVDNELFNFTGPDTTEMEDGMNQQHEGTHLDGEGSESLHITG